MAAAGTAAVVWLHGFGDGPEDWAAGMRPGRRRHGGWKWVHLRAPELPQTCYGGSKVQGWGDYLEEGCTDVGSEDYDSEAIVSDTTVTEVHRVLRELEAADGVPPERVVLGGFSMGATAAAECALRYPRRLGGLCMLNGWLTPAARAALGGRGRAEELPVLISHGSADEQVSLGCGREAARLLAEAGARVQLRVHEGQAHVASGFGPGKEPRVKSGTGVSSACCRCPGRVLDSLGGRWSCEDGTDQILHYSQVPPCGSEAAADGKRRGHGLWNSQVEGPCYRGKRCQGSLQQLGEDLSVPTCAKGQRPADAASGVAITHTVGASACNEDR
ncbi:unnamed protein product [Prorocentrum cordatum]|uniref:Phospholipase/carboxylesterase/thioesterase domain-containing protein n=1 Tax=Prorocentrum cordatum TaxID=2364126 RepID=A0ABN9T0V5_9DINO|nr:unnamed protein product [Polarella glacialis]